jgi:hypothetical protein
MKASIITGHKYGYLTAIAKDSSRSYAHWLFECSCGVKKSIVKYDVLSGRVKSCGCSSRKVAGDTWRRRIAPTVIGLKIGFLAVIKFDHRKNGKSYWKCKCDCGKEITVSLSNIRSKAIRSCGCLRTRKFKPGEAGLKKIYLAYKKSARRKGRFFKLTLNEFRTISSNKCVYCGSDPLQVSASVRTKKKETVEHTKYLFNGIDRIDSSRGYEKDNIVPCCRWCNIIKRERSVQELKDHINRIYQCNAKTKYCRK